MKFARSVSQGVFGVILLVILLFIGTNLINDKLSKQLDNVDLTWSEIDPTIRSEILKIRR